MPPRPSTVRRLRLRLHRRAAVGTVDADPVCWPVTPSVTAVLAVDPGRTYAWVPRAQLGELACTDQALFDMARHHTLRAFHPTVQLARHGSRSLVVVGSAELDVAVVALDPHGFLRRYPHLAQVRSALIASVTAHTAVVAPLCPGDDHQQLAAALAATASRPGHMALPVLTWRDGIELADVLPATEPKR